MLFSRNHRLQLLAGFLAALSLSPCWAAPADDPKKPLQIRPPPSTPAGKGPKPLQIPGAPAKKAHPGVTTTFPVEKYVAEWMKGAREKLQLAPHTKGGIEGWVQFEVEYAIREKMEIPMNQKVPLREQKVYSNSRLAADWVFEKNMKGSGTSSPGLIVELKVESGAQTKRALRDKIDADIRKLQGGFDTKYQDYESTVLAIAWDRETQAMIEKLDMLEVSYSSIDLIGGEKGQTIKLYQLDPSKDPSQDSPNSNPTKVKSGPIEEEGEKAEAKGGKGKGEVESGRQGKEGDKGKGKVKSGTQGEETKKGKGQGGKRV